MVNKITRLEKRLAKYATLQAALGKHRGSKWIRRELRRSDDPATLHPLIQCLETQDNWGEEYLNTLDNALSTIDGIKGYQLLASKLKEYDGDPPQHFRSTFSHVILASFLARHGINIEELEPPLSSGGRTDIQLKLGDEGFLMEHHNRFLIDHPPWLSGRIVSGYTFHVPDLDQFWPDILQDIRDKVKQIGDDLPLIIALDYTWTWRLSGIDQDDVHKLKADLQRQNVPEWVPPCVLLYTTRLSTGEPLNRLAFQRPDSPQMSSNAAQRLIRIWCSGQLQNEAIPFA